MLVAIHNAVEIISPISKMNVLLFLLFIIKVLIIYAKLSDKQKNVKKKKVWECMENGYNNLKASQIQLK